MKIPFLDLSYQTQAVLEDFLCHARGLAEQRQFVGGQPVEQFESAFARYCGARFCVAMNSGTDALRLALIAGGVGPGDEVITSPFTFIATAEAITQTGRLVLADIDPETFTVAPKEVESKLTTRTKVLLPVHIFGLPAPVVELRALAARRGLIVIEDACQAHGAAIGKQKVGSFGQSAAFSFYPTKNLGAFGDAGALTTDAESVAERVRRLRNHGQVGPYEHDEEGFNSRMDALQSVLLSLKLRFLEEWVQQRRRLAAVYRQELGGVDSVRFQKEPENYRHAYHLLAAIVERRAQLIEHLTARGVETRIVYPQPLHLLKAYRHLLYGPGDFPQAESVCEKVLCFPLYPGMTETQVLEAARAVRSFYAG